MATKTPNFNLNKAELTDTIQSTILANNDNFDKIDEALKNSGGDCNIPKFVGTQENPIDFSNLFEGIGNATDGWYQGTKVGQCILQGYVKQMITQQVLPLSELLDLGILIEDEEIKFPTPTAENVEMLFNYVYAADDTQDLSTLFLTSVIGEINYILVGYPGGGILLSGNNRLATKEYVDDEIAKLVERITALEGGAS